MVPEHIQKLLEQRYYLRDEEGNLLENTPEQMYRRVAAAVSRAEVPYDTDEKSLGSDHWYEKFYNLMAEKKFMPSSPTLINAGKEKAGCYSACFCLDVPDSMEGIFEAVKKAAVISKSGGGVGFNFSNLREKGAIVKSTGHEASGPVSFMKVFNTMCDTIAQGGVRRGAMIGLLDVSHPDIEEFISCKDDGVSFTNFNISVSVTDEFMEAVDEDANWQLMFDDNVVPKRVVKAKELWRKICEHAWKTGEPGIVFIDEMNRDVPDELRIIGVNPCLSGDTLLVDKTGLRRIDELQGTLFSSWVTGFKDTVKVKLSSGQELVCTPDHQIKTTDGFIKAQDTFGLKVIVDVPVINTRVEELYDQYVLAGFLFGDGFICGNGEGYAVKLNSEKENDVAALLEQDGFKWQKSGAFYKKLDQVFRYDWYGAPSAYKEIPYEILQNYRILKSFLRGLFEANGSVHSGRVSYKTTSEKLVQQIQIALNALGINSYITTNKPKQVKFSNGEYTCKESYDLNIGTMLGIARFRELIGFISGYKTEKVNAINREYATSHRHPTVVSVTSHEKVKVYDFKMVEGEQPYNSANSIVVHNCGEIGLEDGGSCNLGSMNLFAYLNEDREFHFVDFAQDVKTAVRFMDDVIEVNPYPSHEIANVALSTRKIGLGVMGWADLLIGMQIPYDSEEALQLADEILTTLKEAADEASYSLGIERGDFPASGIAGVHRRNYTLLCVAPTGTISRIAGVSSGIEPIYAWKTFHNIGVPYEEEHWAHSNWLQYSSDIQSKPDYMVTASEISPVWHLRHQAKFQEYMDNSVSKTINLPSSTTVEDVERIFMQAYDSNCKGTTVYRDGSRDNQPLTDTNKILLETLHNAVTKHKEIEETKFPEEIFLKEDPYKDWEPEPSFRQRGHIAVGVTHKIDTGKGKIYITVNYDRAQQDAVEVFIRLGPSATPKEIELGDWVGRMLSLCLKHNVPVKDIVRQSEKVYGESSFIYMNRFFNSLPQLIAHLINFSWAETLEMVELEDGSIDPEEGWDDFGGSDIEEITVAQQAVNADNIKKYDGEYCYECNEYAKYREGGCLVCENCGDSSCG